jgi:tRNA threonylcarbamoyladenosine biosynthesis protein TsaE
MSTDAGPIVCRTASEEQTIALGMALAESLRAGDVVAIDGELGAGKTRLVRGIAMGLGVSPGEVRSPTYALAHEYASAPGRPRVVHVDAYRLSGADDLDSIGWDRIAGPDAIVLVEWAERVAPSLPAERFAVRIAHAGEDAREITIACPPGREARGARGYAALVAGKEAGQRTCRSCGRAIDASIETFPFCSMRCRQADLGAWFSEKYRISRDVTERDLDEG